MKISGRTINPPTRHVSILLLTGLFLFFSFVTITQAGVETPERRSDLDSHSLFEISLITIAPTDHLFEWFGHTVLSVKNRRTGNARAYSFGGFSFGVDDFLMFTMGNFKFWSYSSDTVKLLERYRRKGRHIVVQQLRLTSLQTDRIMRQLTLAMKPENRFYEYDHFRDNCATRLRNIVDRALEGAIRRQSSESAGMTIRDTVQRMTAHLPALNFLLQFLLSSGTDQPINHWETMFLPDRLMAVFQNTNNPETGSPLVAKRSEVVPGTESPFFRKETSVPQTKGRDWGFGLTAGLMLMVSAWFYLRPHGGENRFRGLQERAYPALVALFGAVFGLLGVVLFFMAVIASHKDVYWNENFFLLNPLTFVLLPLGLMRLFGRATRAFSMVSILCAVGAVIGFGLQLLPAFSQDNGQQIRVLLPALFIIGVTGYLETRRSDRS